MHREVFVGATSNKHLLFVLLLLAFVEGAQPGGDPRLPLLLLRRVARLALALLGQDLLLHERLRFRANQTTDPAVRNGSELH
jgi:hypothetical protein